MRRCFYVSLLALPLLAPLSACTTPRAGGLERAEADPWEKSNRKIYAFNKKLDKYALKPAAQVYRTAVPTAARHGITNVYNTYNEPLNFINALLQGKIKQAFRSVDRFMINATLGVGGLADNATELGRPEEPEDWGQTFATWGIKSGPYLMLPLFGPSTLRDSFGLGFDFLVNPADFARNAAFNPTLLWQAGQVSVRIVNLRARIADQGGDAVLANSLDEYTLVKSAYLQRRKSDIWDGNPPYVPEDDGTAEDAAPSADAPAPAPASEPSAAPPPK
ncbi:MAG: VacJ family lipoprotein [Alphaproteobacteria bacterium PA4]|nr:MAG: VacJ family lipoprotein [Alphaproteobacteria bacterium PA4]